MKNIEDILVIMMKRIPASAILEKQVTYNDCSLEMFVKVASLYMKHYSESELENLHDYLSEYVRDNLNELVSRVSDYSGINVFDIVIFLSRSILLLSSNQVLCKYHKLLEWRNLTLNLSEDIFTCSFLAVEDDDTDERKDFFWNVTIGHNNQMLNRMMEKGIADNHFHLWASAPYFYFFWANMMVQTDDSYYADVFKLMDERKLYVNYSYDIRYRELPASVQTLQAMLIRAYLYAWLTREKIVLGEYLVTWKDLKGGYVWKFKEYERGNMRGKLNEEEEREFERLSIKIRNKECIALSEVVDILTRDCYERLWWEKTFQQMKLILASPENINYHKHEIQAAVIRLCQGRTEDYALKQIPYSRKDTLAVERLFCGERWFLYQMFCRIEKDRGCYKEQYNWFYAYLCIKENFRSEMVQVNDKIGLINFERYFLRKGVSMPTRGDLIANLALRGTLKNRNVRYLEARIAPCKTAEKDKELILMLDNMMTKEEKQRCYYVMHFKKGKDMTSVNSVDQHCRHSKKRKEIKDEASALAAFRIRYPLLAGRVLGIDACSAEIGCRPEVFAQAFRYLRNHTVQVEDGLLLDKIPQLKVTYHVGEDYLDIADGLRAIDEAIHFLRMDCGDRFGHALVLGENVANWYHRKNYRILLPKQDYLDNIAWMYGRLIEFNVREMENLLHYLEAEYEYYFKDIYGDCMLNEGRDYTILAYYYSQKLRGDNPECYRTGKLVKTTNWENDYDSYAVNFSLGEKKDFRKIPEAVQLFYFYHYSKEAKQRGARVIQKDIPFFWIKGIMKLQKKMQEQVARHGISIESNPSSNLLIGGYSKYEEHPIVKLYNHDLVADPVTKQECAQISVSINTDDKGIFATSLENEYALIACSLEQCKDNEDNLMYDRILVYRWLDRVREFGITQIFKEKKEEEDEGI